MKQAPDRTLATASAANKVIVSDLNAAAGSDHRRLRRDGSPTPSAAPSATGAASGGQKPRLLDGLVNLADVYLKLVDKRVQAVAVEDLLDVHVTQAP